MFSCGGDAGDGAIEAESAAECAGAQCTYTAGAACPEAVAGGGFVHLPITEATGLGYVEIVATPSAAYMDAVIGLSRGPADSFGDLAAAVRFSPGGVIDARDGGAYGAVQPIAYQAGEPVRFRIVADIPTHTFSVLASFGGNPPVEVARLFGFRNGQEAVGQLDTIDLIVDSAAGTLTSCEYRSDVSRGVAYSRYGNHAVAPLANDQAYVTDGASAVRFGAHGETITSLGVGGQAIAADDAGNVYLASAGNGSLTLDAYSGIAQTYHRVYAVAPDAYVTAAALDATGHLVVALSQGYRVRTVQQFASDGTPGWTVALDAQAVGLGRDGFAVARDGDAPTVSRYTAAGALAWTQSCTGDYAVRSIALAPDGSLAFAGWYDSALSCAGGPTLETHQGSEYNVNTYAVALAPSGAHRFSQIIGNSDITAVATNGSRIAVAGIDIVGPRFAHLTVLDTTGAIVDGDPWTGLGEISISSRMAMGASGRVYWNYLPRWPITTPFANYPYLLAIDP